MVVDAVCFNGEFDLFDLRYNILKDYVDLFVVCESNKTFSGNDKPFYFKNILNKYKNVRYCMNYDGYSPKEIELAYSSPNTKGAEHWKLEFMQKERIKLGLIDLADDDIVFINDCDEIWDPKVALKWSHAPFKFKLNVYTYYLNNYSNEEFYGTLVSPYRDIRNECLNHLRTDAWKTIFYGGWHFTSMASDLRAKLTDSYTKETYANDWVMDNLQENIKNNKDFLGRNFQYQVDENEWPKYLKDNRQKFAHLLK